MKVKKRSKSTAKILVENFFQGKKILIVDSSVGMRSTIAKIFRDLGASTFDIAQASNYATALNLLQQLRPCILICDYNLGAESGLQLVRLRNKSMAGTPGLFSIIITSSSREAAVVASADEDIDCAIFKPFTTASFQTYVERMILERTQPGRYEHGIELGKAFLALEDFEGAEKAFIAAAALHPAPALAKYYLGRIYLIRHEAGRAGDAFREGLEGDPNHFRCLTGLFELYVRNDQKPEAYEIAKRILTVSPVSPQRLEEILRLAVSLRRFDDILLLYKCYLDTEYRHPQLIKAMLAALVIGGKYFLGARENEKALDHFRKAMVSSGRSITTFREIITTLLKSGMTSEATEFAKELPKDQKANPEYRSLDYLIVDQLQQPIEIINAGMKLLTEKINHPSIYKILIHRYLEIGKKDQAELLALEASKLWPEEALAFNEPFLVQTK